MSFLMSELVIRGALAGLGVALTAPWLGVFVVWRRMAYFGDATAHAAILGVALSLLGGLPVPLGVLGVAVVMALAVATMESGRPGLGADSLLGVLSHGALAIGLIAISFHPGARLNIETYLFGDILVVSWTDVWVIWGGGALIVTRPDATPTELFLAVAAGMTAFGGICAAWLAITRWR